MSVDHPQYRARIRHLTGLYLNRRTREQAEIARADLHAEVDAIFERLDEKNGKPGGVWAKEPKAPEKEPAPAGGGRRRKEVS